MNEGELDASRSADPVGDPSHSPTEQATDGSADSVDAEFETGHPEVRSLLSALASPSIPEHISARIDVAVQAEVAATVTAQSEVAQLLRGLEQPQIPSAVAAAIDTTLATERAALESGSAVLGLAKPKPSRARAVFALAAAAAAVVIISKNPWTHQTGEVTAAGPTSNASHTNGNQDVRKVEPTQTLIQVSRHAYHRSSLNAEVLAMANGQAAGASVQPSNIPTRWRAVAICAQQHLAQRGIAAAAKVDLGWFDGKPSAVILVPSSSGEPAAVTVLQESSGMCSIAASTRLLPTSH